MSDDYQLSLNFKSFSPRAAVHKMGNMFSVHVIMPHILLSCSPNQAGLSHVHQFWVCPFGRTTRKSEFQKLSNKCPRIHIIISFGKFEKHAE